MNRMRIVCGFALIAVCSVLAGCGACCVSIGGGQTTPTTPTVTVTPASTSITTAQALTVTIAVSASAGQPVPTGSVTLSSGSYSSAATQLTSGSASVIIAVGQLPAGTSTLSAKYTPDAASTALYYSATGSATVTVTALALATPTVTVSPSSSSITTAQSLQVNITVSGGAGMQTPTGSVTLTSGSYTSSSVALNNGSASFTIPAGTLPTGTDTLSAQYQPDAASSAAYAAASGSATVTVTVPATPTVKVSPSPNSITTAQSLLVNITVTGSAGMQTPTGSVTLTSGSYTSSSVTLSSGSASVTIPAGTLPTGTDTLSAKYQPDVASSAAYTAASGSATVTVTVPQTYVLTVDSAAPSSGISMSVSPSDNNGAGNGTTPFTRTYTAETAVTVSAPQNFDSGSFVSWSGCTSTPSPSVCSVTVNANSTVIANYIANAITSIAVSPATATIGVQQQFTATVNGTGTFSQSVSWSLSCSACGNLSPGTLTSGGLYTTPYPAPASVVITATSTQDSTKSGSVTVSLNLPATSAGPALTVDVANRTHPISPDIYGMNGYSMQSSVAKAVNLPVDRWGGDATSRYNYVLDVSSSASDWYFENYTQATGQQATSGFNAQVESDASVGAKTMGTVPVLGWVAKNGTVCSFPTSLYPHQVATDPYRSSCGDGLYPQGVNGCTNAGGCNITGNDPTQTSQQVGPSWAGAWVAYLVSKFGTAANGGVAIYDLDNEPAWWDAVHRDVHSSPSTYDEVTNNGIAAAKAIKAADPTAAVSGPVVDYWWNYFYSKKDIENGWSNGSPCWQPWSNPTDRQAHGGVPFVEYYLQQFNSASTTYGARLLDYLDLHTYFAGTYNGSGVGLTTAGNTEEQKVRLDSTRVFWDPTYTDPNYPQPNYTTDSNYTTSCNVPLQAPQLIPMAQKWVANDYPGTKIAFTEYNWGGQENINGAVAQADILGIFGKYGLDLATLWGPPDPTTQLPGLMAFEIYRNYDGHNAMFGDTALASTSSDQASLAVYGALRSSDSAITIMVVNKSYGALTSTLSLNNYSGTASSAQVYQYSNANLNQIVSQPALPITAPSGGTTASTISATFPGQSITLLIVPN